MQAIMRIIVLLIVLYGHIGDVLLQEEHKDMFHNYNDFRGHLLTSVPHGDKPSETSHEMITSLHEQSVIEGDTKNITERGNETPVSSDILLHQQQVGEYSKTGPLFRYLNVFRKRIRSLLRWLCEVYFFRSCEVYL